MTQEEIIDRVCQRAGTSDADNAVLESAAEIISSFIDFTEAFSYHMKRNNITEKSANNFGRLLIKANQAMEVFHKP